MAPADLTEPLLDEFLATCEDMLAVLDAAETQLRVLAANELPFTAAMRIHRNAVRRSRAILAEAGLTLARPAPRELERREDDTEELLHAALHGASRTAAAPQGPQPPTRATAPEATASDLDEGPEGSADVSMPIVTDESDLSLLTSLPLEDQLRALQDEIGASSQLDTSAPLVTFDAPSSLVEFDESAIDETTPALDDEDEDEEVTSSVHRSELLVSLDGSSPLDAHESSDEARMEHTDEATIVARMRQANEAALVQFENDGPGFEEFEDDGEPGPVGRPLGRETTFDLGSDSDLHDENSEETIIATRASLFGLQPSLSTGAAADAEEHDQSSVGEVILTKGVAQLAAPSGPAPLDAPRATPPVSRPPTRASISTPPSASPSVTAATRSPSGGLPTIRDPVASRGRSAAIQLGPQGGTGKVLGMEEEEEALEMGEAEGYDDDSASGLRIAVEEYEDDDEPEADDEQEPVTEPPAAIQPLATLAATDIQALLSDAASATERGDFEQAVQAYSEAIDFQPDHIQALLARGRVYLERGDYARAMSDFIRAQAHDQEGADPQVAFGELYYHRKDYRKAIEYFDDALARNAKHANAYCYRGISHYYRKNYNEAVDDLLKAQKLDPEIPNIQTYVSMARKKANKK